MADSLKPLNASQVLDMMKHPPENVDLSKIDKRDREWVEEFLGIMKEVKRLPKQAIDPTQMGR